MTMSENRVEINPYDYMDHFMKKAALLVSMGKDGKLNVMALLWKTIGELWMIPVITVAVAPNRYTFELLTKGVKEFTVNIPSDRIEHAISTCGTLSGRDTDKFKEVGLEIIKGKRTSVPTVKDSDLAYECQIIHEADSGSMASHHLFFGKILTAYASKEIIN
ncbi:MAG: flavin reductase family protein [Promethearchaeota archaeon]